MIKETYFSAASNITFTINAETSISANPTPL